MATEKTTSGMFSLFLREKMGEKNLTQAELASACGLTQAAVSKYLQGRIPKGEELVAVARALGTTAEALLGLEVPKGERPVEELLDLPHTAVTDEEADRALLFMQAGPEALLALRRTNQANAALAAALTEAHAAAEAYLPHHAKLMALFDGGKKRPTRKAAN